LIVEYKKIVKVDELAFVIPRKAGATFSQLWQIFYYTRMFKYISYRHYIQIKPAYNKICTYKNLQALCALGYLKSPQYEVYCATNKVLPILKEAGFNTDILPLEPIGKGDINELNNTDVFVEATKLPHFYAALHHNFGYLIPDALLVQLDKENEKYKLTFLEIEAKKPDWENYLEKKRDSYFRLAKDIQFYNYWASICKLLKLPRPGVSELKFSTCFIGNIKKDFGNGFQFVHKISDLS
jgi:hypothetical protein